MTMWRDWRWVAAVAAVIAAVGLLLLAYGQYIGQRDDVEARAVTECRSQLSGAVTDKQTDYLLTIGALVGAIPGRDPALIESQLAALGDAGVALSDARDARVAFDEHPSGDC